MSRRGKSRGHKSQQQQQQRSSSLLPRPVQEEEEVHTTTNSSRYSKPFRPVGLTLSKPCEYVSASRQELGGGEGGGVTRGAVRPTPRDYYDLLLLRIGVTATLEIKQFEPNSMRAVQRQPHERSVSAPTTTAVLTESVLVDTLKLAQRYSSAAASRSSSGVQIEVPTSAAYQPQQQKRQKVQVEERNAKALLLPVSSPPPSYEPATTVSALDCYDLQQRRPSDNSCGWVSPSMSPPVEYRDPLHNSYSSSTPPPTTASTKHDDVQSALSVNCLTQ